MTEIRRIDEDDPQSLVQPEIDRSAEGYLMNARPHPGPLPQERVNRWPLFRDQRGIGARTHFRASLSEAAIATAPENFSNAAAVLSLSPGERAGVRASVPLIFFPLRTHRLRVTRQRSRRARLQLPEDRIAN